MKLKPNAKKIIVISIIFLICSKIVFIKEFGSELIKNFTKTVLDIFKYIGNNFTNLEQIFSSRNIAFILVIVFIFFIATRNNLNWLKLKEVISAFFCKEIIMFIGAFLFYFIIIIILLVSEHIMTMNYVSISIIWFVFVGITLSMKIINDCKNINQFLNILKNSILLMVVSFIMNIDEMQFIYELVIKFLVIVLYLFNYSKYTNEDLINFDVIRKSRFISFFLKFFLFLNASYYLYSQRNVIDYFIVGKGIMSQIILLLLCSVFLFFTLLFTKYQSIDIILKNSYYLNEKFHQGVFKHVFKECWFSVEKLSRLIDDPNLTKFPCSIAGICDLKYYISSITR